jgi:hypothetical protein
MSNVGEKSRFVLILLAWLVILLHSIIPHHHHLDSYSDQNNNNSCTTQTKDESPTEANKHCHALNNVVFKKDNTITVDSNTVSNALLYVITSINQVKFYNRVLFTTSPFKDIVILKQYLTADLSFRGPPASA